MKRYLMSQYGRYISKIKTSKCWLTVELIDELRADKENYCKVQSAIQKTCEQLWDFPNNITIG